MGTAAAAAVADPVAVGETVTETSAREKLVGYPSAHRASSGALISSLLKGGIVRGRPRVSVESAGGMLIFTLAPEIVVTGPTAALL